MQLFKRRAILTPKQLRKAKISLGLAALYIGVQIVAAEVTAYVYDGKTYDKEEITLYPRGRIVEYTDKEEFCKR